MKEQYKPSVEEINKAEEMMIDEQIKSTKERVATLEAALDLKNWEAPKTPDDIVNLTIKSKLLERLSYEVSNLTEQSLIEKFGGKEAGLSSEEVMTKIKEFAKENEKFMLAQNAKAIRGFQDKKQISEYFSEEYGITLDEEDIERISSPRRSGGIEVRNSEIQTVLEWNGWKRMRILPLMVKISDGNIHNI